MVRDDSDKYEMEYFSLAYAKLDRKMNPFLIEYRKPDRVRPMMTHEDDEFFLLLEGEVDFIISDSDSRRKMVPGDTVYLSKNIPHTVELSDSAEFAKALVVYSS